MNTPTVTRFPGGSSRRRASVPEAGFTAVELLVVVVVIGLLAAIAIPAFLGQARLAVNHSRAQDHLRVTYQIASEKGLNACDDLVALGFRCSVQENPGQTAIVAVLDGYQMSVNVPAGPPDPCRGADGKLLPAVAVAMPVVTGRTGLYGFRLCMVPAVQRGAASAANLVPAVQGQLLPGALAERRRMLAELRRAARAQLDDLQPGLSLHSGRSSKRVRAALRILNSDGDDQISVAEILSARAPWDDTLRPLFGPDGLLTKFKFGEIMRFDTANENLDAIRVSSSFDLLSKVEGLTEEHDHEDDHGHDRER